MARILSSEDQKEEIIRCMADPLYWFRNYYLTFDKPIESVRSFPDWPYLEDFIRELDAGGRILVEKSRDMMITITVAGYMLYSIQFKPNWSGFVTSRREDEVDDGGPNATTDSIFGVILFGHQHQPDWLAAPLSFTHLRIQNEEGLNSYITGESANVNAGRGKSVTFKWGDEFAFVQQSEKVHASMSGGAFRTLLYTSTSNLSGNAFHRIRTDPGSGFRVLTYRWDMRPDRDAAWYADKAAGMDAITKAKELDIEYDVSSSLNVYPDYSYDAHTLPVDEMPSIGPVILTFDEGFASPGAMYVGRVVDGVLYIVDEVYKAGVHVQVDDMASAAGVASWCEIALQKVRDYGSDDQRAFLETGKGEQPVIVVGPESRSAADAFRVAGFNVHLTNKDKLGRIRMVDRRMKLVDGKPRLYIGRNCSSVLKEIPNYRRRVVGGVVQEAPRDGNDHGCDALADLVGYLESEHKVVHKRVSDLDHWYADGRL